MLSSLLIGCSDSDSSQSRRAFDQLDRALKQIEQVEQGYVPPAWSRSHDGSTSLQAYRRDQLDKVIQSLDASIMQLGGARKLQASNLQSATQRLLADYHASDARHQLRQALGNWGQVSSRSTLLLGRMFAIDQADSRKYLLNIDEAPLLDTLHQRKIEVGRQLETYQQRVSQAHLRIKSWMEQMDQLQSQKEQAIRQAAQLRRAAFRQTGQAQLNIYHQEAEARLRGAGKERQTQLLALKRELESSRMRIDQQQIDVLENSLQWLDEQVIQIRQRQDTASQIRQQARQDVEALAVKFQAEFELVQGDYTTQVAQLFDAAAQTAQQAQDVLRTTRSRGSDRPLAQLDQLTALLTHLHILTQHISARRSYGQTLKLLVQQTQRLISQSGKSVQSAVEKMQGRRDYLVLQFNKVANDARELAIQIAEGTGDEETKNAALRQKEHVDAYQQRIEQP